MVRFLSNKSLKRAEVLEYSNRFRVILPAECPVYNELALTNKKRSRTQKNGRRVPVYMALSKPIYHDGMTTRDIV